MAVTDKDVIAEAKRIVADRLQRPGEHLMECFERTRPLPYQAFDLLPELIRIIEAK